MSLLVCVAVQKKLNFDLLTLSSGSWGGVGEEGSAASGRGLCCLPMSHNKDARLIWVNKGPYLLKTWSIELVLNNVANFRKILIKKSGHHWCDVRTDARTDRRMYGQTDRGNT